MSVLLPKPFAEQMTRSSISHISMIVVNMSIHILIAFIFISLMFYLLIAPIEERMLQSKLDELVVTMVDENKSENTTFNILEEIVRDNSQKTNDNLKQKYSGENELMVINNRWVLILVAVVTFTMFIIPLILLLSMKFMCKMDNVRMTDIIKYNLLVLLFVVSFEIYFIIQVGSNYIPINPEIFIKELTESSTDKLITILKA